VDSAQSHAAARRHQYTWRHQLAAAAVQRCRRLRNVINIRRPGKWVWRTPTWRNITEARGYSARADDEVAATGTWGVNKHPAASNELNQLRQLKCGVQALQRRAERQLKLLALARMCRAKLSVRERGFILSNNPAAYYNSFFRTCKPLFYWHLKAGR
jgi:hypothetical protein